MSQPLFPSSARLVHAYQQSRYAVPAVYQQQAAVQSQQQQQPAPVESHSSPLSSSAILFGHEQSAYRSSMHQMMPAVSESPMHQLAQSQFVARAVHLPQPAAAYEQQHAWQPHAHATMTQQKIGADAWPTTIKQQQPLMSKQAVTAIPPSSELPSLSSLQVSAPPAMSRSQSLPTLPVYLESSCFSLAKAAMAPRDLWTNLKSHLRSCGVVVAERSGAAFELECAASNGMACSQFRVCCYSGHYRDSGSPVIPAPSAAVCYTVDFQRMSGCSVAFLQLFQLMLCLLKDGGEAPLQLESKVAAAADIDAAAPMPMPPAAGAADNLDVDLSLLPIPSLRHSSSVGASPGCIPSVALSPCSSVLDSLHDLLTSADPCSQVAGMHALALCLDGSQPQRERQLMAEVASMLCEGQSEHVKQVAAMLIAKAAQLPSAQTALLDECLPACIDSLIAPAAQTGTTAPAAARASALDLCLAQSRSKCLQALQACIRLTKPRPAEFDAAMAQLAADTAVHLQAETRAAATLGARGGREALSGSADQFSALVASAGTAPVQY